MRPEAPGAAPHREVPGTADVDREHLRLLTDQPSQKAEDLGANNARLRALINIGLELASERDTERRLQRGCVAARDLFAATSVTIGILDRCDGTVQRLVSSGLDPATWVTIGDAGSAIFGAVVADRRAWRGNRPGDALIGLPPDVQAVLAAPIASPARVYGWMCLLGDAGRIFTEDDEQLVVALAGQLGRVHGLEEDILARMGAIGELAGDIAHDFNNLLTAILGYGELLLDDLGTDDPRRADIAQIQKAGARAAGLTRQLLTLSRRQAIEPSLLDLNAVVTDMQPVLARLIQEEVTVVLKLSPSLPGVLADRGQAEQIVLNLALIARDAMSAGGRLTIETAIREIDESNPTDSEATSDRPSVALTVTNTGPAMTPQLQGQPAEPRSTARAGGQGIGFATVEGLARRNGGTVRMRSDVGSGTSVTVDFPAVNCQKPTGDTPVAPPPLAAGAKTVLVVEDAEALREMTRRMLERQGYTVLVAANADEAVWLFEQSSSIDVLLTDVVMPGASGPDLTRRLIERRPTMKVIYMSGYSEEVIVHHGVLNAGIAFLHKPFTSETLGLKIREVLDQ